MPDPKIETTRAIKWRSTPEPEEKALQSMSDHYPERHQLFEDSLVSFEWFCTGIPAGSSLNQLKYSHARAIWEI